MIFFYIVISPSKIMEYVQLAICTKISILLTATDTANEEVFCCFFFFFFLGGGGEG